MYNNYRNSKIKNYPQEFEFQAFDWNTKDVIEEVEEDSNSDSEFESDNKKQDGIYTMRIYGVTEKSESVCLIVKNFTPYFFVKIPQFWKNTDLRKLVSYLKTKVYYKYSNSVINATIVERKDFMGFSDNKIFKYARFEFQSHESYKSYARELDKPIQMNGRKNYFKLYESNIDPFLRFIHVKELNPCGWIKLEKDKFKYIKGLKQTNSQYEIECNWMDVQPSEKTHIGPLTIASFDIECTSSDGSFPDAQREGDKVIQIGTTVNRYGERECFLKHMITLGKCNPIEGVVVESYDTEEEVLMAWKKFIQKLNPDIITGYNIWGFDFKYMYDRAKFLGCEKRFSKLGRFKKAEGKLIEKQLSSSALGQNQFYFLEMEGICQIDLMKLVQKDYKLDMYKLDFVANHFLKSNKVDLSPKELFKKYRENTPESIKDIAVYCVQDCALCNQLINKLEAVTNNVGMANVCFVPFAWLFLRGQGVKIYSLVAKKCREAGFVIPTIKKSNDISGYEGAIVLVATPGIYLDPISVMDYSSLYPSCMISENISHDTMVWYKIVDNNNNLIREWGNKQYFNLENYTYNVIEYDNFEENELGKKEKTGKTICCYAENKNGEKGVMPNILNTLLFERRKTRASINYKLVKFKDGTTDDGFVKEEGDNIFVTKYKSDPVKYNKNDVEEIVEKNNEFQKAILDGLQLAYKVTANSLYGQLGAKTSPIYFKELAASTTATGRDLLRKARYYTESKYPGAECVYGDTDSIFVNFSKHWENELGLKLEGKEALKKSIELGIEAGKYVTSHLKKPHDLEYEKTFYPFVQLAKKRYVGNLYELDVNKFKQKSMGIVLKRRDNANIVKIIYGGIIDIIMNKQDIHEARKYFLDEIDNLLQGNVNIKDLIITKTLRAQYKNPDQQAHKVLADRMAKRDPGNKPQSNDRIPFVYIQKRIKRCEKLLQGDRVEHPDYIKANKNIKIDYKFYLDKQVTVPCIQLFALDLENLPGYRDKFVKDSIAQIKRKWEKRGKNEKEVNDKISEFREKETKSLLIGDILLKFDNKVNNNSMITDFFKISTKKININDMNINLEKKQTERIKRKNVDMKILNNSEEKTQIFKETIMTPNYSVSQRLVKIKARKKEEKKKKNSKV